MLTFICEGCGVPVVRRQRYTGHKHVFCTTQCSNKNRKLARTADQRFWAKVQRGTADECWLWLAGTIPTGYGSFRVGGRSILAHRYALLSVGRPAPDDLFVCHRCDTPRCCNPDHLFVGTCADNVADMMAKGRYGKNRRVRRGEDVNTAKLTAAQVATVRSRYAEGVSQPQMARELGVSVTAIHYIVHGRNWSATC